MDKTRDTLVDAMRAQATSPAIEVEEAVTRLMDKLTSLRRQAGLADSAGTIVHDTANSGPADSLPAGAEESQPTHQAYDFLAPPRSADEMGRLGSYRVLRVLGIAERATGA